MLDGNDTQTFHSLRILYDTIADNSRSIAFWIGAGTSSWCGYPRWDDLARIIHSGFIRYEHRYNKKKGIEYIEAKTILHCLDSVEMPTKNFISHS
jgi:hypothetical protein